jgi:hypothetical protein
LWQTALALLAKLGVEKLVTDVLTAGRSVMEVDWPGGKAVKEEY